MQLTLDQAIALALQHNHALLASRTLIQQSQADQVTANLRPNPVISGDSIYFPVLNSGDYTRDYLNNGSQFDLGIGYLFERGKKRQHRLQAAKDVTAVTTAQVADNGRTLTFNVASQFIAALLAQSNLEFAEQTLGSYQQTVDVSDSQYRAGAISEGDLLKIRLQLLQFQTDASAAKLARVEALASLRQLLGYNSVPPNYHVAGNLQYQAMTAGEDDLKAMALRDRPDVRAAELGVTAAQSQLALAHANGKRNVNATVDYTHTAGVSSTSWFVNVELPIFDRNQGQIAHARYAVTESQQLSGEQSSIALTDVDNAYQALRTSAQVVQLYQSGYLKQAQESRDISLYAYQRGATSLLDYLDAERSYRATELAYRQALANYMITLEQLREAVGTRSLP